MTSKCTNPGLCHKNFGITRFNTIELMLGTDFANLELSNEMSLSLARVVCLIYLLVASNFRIFCFGRARRPNWITKTNSRVRNMFTQTSPVSRKLMHLILHLAYLKEPCTDYKKFS